MRIKTIICFITLLILIGISPVYAFTEMDSNIRSIYIGDIITLKITARDFSTQELTDIFKDFEIIEIKEDGSSYLLSLRTFEAGDYNILLGNNQISINVRSILSDIERDDIFEGDIWVIEPGISFNGLLLLCLSAGVFISSGAIVLLKAIKRKAVIQNPLQLFISRSCSLSAESDDYFVDLTLYFKEYLENLYKFRIIGKTSSEIVNELSKIEALAVMLPDIREWLIECDRLKFTGVKVLSETKQIHCRKLVDIVEKIYTDINKDVAA